MNMNVALLCGRRAMRQGIGLAGLLIALAQPAEAEPAPNTLTDVEREAGWRLLFDGETMAGWRAYRKDTVPPGWAVINGALVCLPAGDPAKGTARDDLVTTEQFEDFDLQLEWKISPKANTGVLYHVSEEPLLAWHLAPEVQLVDNTQPHLLTEPKRQTGACYDLYAPSKDVTKPPGEWNRLRILVDGSHVEHWINGEKVVEYELGSDEWRQRVASSKHSVHRGFARMKAGPIALQDHSGRAEFRNIKIKVFTRQPGVPE